MRYTRRLALFELLEQKRPLAADTAACDLSEEGETAQVDASSCEHSLGSTFLLLETSAEDTCGNNASPGLEFNTESDGDEWDEEESEEEIDEEDEDEDDDEQQSGSESSMNASTQEQSSQEEEDEEEEDEEGEDDEEEDDEDDDEEEDDDDDDDDDDQDEEESDSEEEEDDDDDDDDDEDDDDDQKNNTPTGLQSGAPQTSGEATASRQTENLIVALDMFDDATSSDVASAMASNMLVESTGSGPEQQDLALEALYYGTADGESGTNDLALDGRRSYVQQNESKLITELDEEPINEIV